MATKQPRRRCAWCGTNARFVDRDGVELFFDNGPYGYTCHFCGAVRIKSGTSNEVWRKGVSVGGVELVWTRRRRGASE